MDGQTVARTVSQVRPVVLRGESGRLLSSFLAIKVPVLCFSSRHTRDEPDALLTPSTVATDLPPPAKATAIVAPPKSTMELNWPGSDFRGLRPLALQGPHDRPSMPQGTQRERALEEFFWNRFGNQASFPWSGSSNFIRRAPEMQLAFTFSDGNFNLKVRASAFLPLGFKEMLAFSG